MNILIVGSKGFIGQHCLNYFNREGNVVFGCDVVTDYSAQNYFLIDATNSDFKAVFSKNSFDVCINCSGAAEVSASITNPARDYMLNTENVFTLLDAIRSYQPQCRFINISSAAVYGNPHYLPIDEKHPLNPISPYGFHKKMAEDICTEFYELFKLKTCSLRVFSAYGEGLKKQIFWDLFQKCQNTELVELLGSGVESRDYIYVNDILQAMDLIIRHDAFNNSVYNIANGIEVKISQAAETFYSEYNPKIKIRFMHESKPGYPINWVADISKLTGLGYKSKYSLQDGIKNYIEWLRNLK